MKFPVIASKYDYVNVFFNNLAPLVVNEYVHRSGQKRLYPSTVLAMAALESGYNLKAPTLFGIKGDGVVLDTTEYINGENINIKDSFKIYGSLAEAIQGLYDLVQWCHYDKATSATDYEEECRMLQECGYATDPEYADKLINIVNSYQLTMFNNIEEAADETTEEPETPAEPHIYTVKSGDSLWSIVKEYYNFDNVTDIADKINEVVEFNDLGNPNIIYVGENITLI